MDAWTHKVDTETGEKSDNVVGRFDDHTVLDMDATRAANLKPPFAPKTKQVIALNTKLERNSLGGVSTDISSCRISFDKRPLEALTHISEFLPAWREYQKRRKAPLQPQEIEVLRVIWPEYGKEFEAKPVKQEIVEHAPNKKRGRPRKTRPYEKVN